MQRISRLTYPLLVFGLALTLAACGGDREEPTSTPPAATDTPSAAADTPVPATDTPAADTPVPTEPAAADTPAADLAAGSEVTATVTTTETADYPSPAEAQPAEAAPAGEDGAYPAPAPTFDAYPPPVTPTPETSRIPIVPFVIERPLAVGDTVVRGTGPANVPILIIDASFMGDILGKGVIGPDGKFEIETLPMENEHWVGLVLDDLTGTDFAYEDFYATGFRGPRAESVPNVAMLYDSVVIGQE